MLFAAIAYLRLARGLVAWRADHARFFVSGVFGLLGGNRSRGRRKLASLAASAGAPCRMFHGIAELDEHAMQGTACSDKRGEWTIAEAKPQNKT